MKPLADRPQDLADIERLENEESWYVGAGDFAAIENGWPTARTLPVVNEGEKTFGRKIEIGEKADYEENE